ncbi:hypothetical protein ACOALA_13710 [Alicyclobacillus acidoterrestris]|uniref:hypothetical protein n=1 Tax=Alicyclobacillus acidoterrestris TaxID=1450 RepID=UPI003F5398E4
MLRRETLALSVRVVRAAKRITQEDIAQENLIDRSVVSNLESGKLHKPELVFHIIDRAGGVQMLDRLMEKIKAIREWFVVQQESQLLYI